MAVWTDGRFFISHSPKIYNENVVDLLSDAATGGRQSPAKNTTARARQESNFVSPTVSPGVSPTGNGNGNGRGGDGVGLLKPTIRENKVKLPFFAVGERQGLWEGGRLG